MERVLARQQEKPYVLCKAQLSLRIFQESLEDDNEQDNSIGQGLTADTTNKAPVSQRSEPKAQQVHMAVDPDVMEFVTTTSRHDQLKQALAVKKSEINWKPNNKTAVIVYRGEDERDSWQSESIKEVQSYLGQFPTCDVEVNKDFWEAVKTQLPNIRACFGNDPPLVKLIKDCFVARIVSLSSDAKKHEDKLKEKLEEIYRQETRKTYGKLTRTTAKERLILFKKLNFAEKLKQDNKELEIKLDIEAGKVYFEGPPLQIIEAKMNFHKLEMEMVEKKLDVSKNILEVLGTDKGLQRVKCEFEKTNVEAVFFVNDNEAWIMGTSAAQADNAESLVSKLTLEEKVRVDQRSQDVLKTQEWCQMCDALNTRESVRVYRNNGSDTLVAGFREDVMKAREELEAYLENNYIQTERFACSSKLFIRYLNELRQEDLHSIETQLADFEVKIQKGKGDDDFVISGKKGGLERGRRKLDVLVAGINSTKFDIKQPGLRKFFSSGNGDRLVKSVEKDHACAIQVQTRWDKKEHDMRSRDAGAGVEPDASNGDDDDDYEDRERDGEDHDDAADGDDDDDDNEDEEEEKEEEKEEKEEKEEELAVLLKTGPSAFVTANGQKLSWRAGYIQTEKVSSSK